jgi:hypothetical protein
MLFTAAAMIAAVNSILAGAGLALLAGTLTPLGSASVLAIGTVGTVILFGLHLLYGYRRAAPTAGWPPLMVRRRLSPPPQAPGAPTTAPSLLHSSLLQGRSNPPNRPWSNSDRAPTRTRERSVGGHDMNQTIGQGGGLAALPPRRIGEILSTAFQLYRRHWRTLVAIAAVVVIPLTLLQYGIGHWFRTNGQQLHDPAEVSTSFWAVASASLLAALVGLLLYQVLTGAITRTIAAEVTGQDLDLEQSYRFGFARLGPILVVSVLVGLATLLGLIVFIIPGIYIGVRLAVSIQALVVEGKRGTEAMRRSWDLVGRLSRTS